MSDIRDYLMELKASIEGYGFQCHIETYKAAINALEKQIPKKVKTQLREMGEVNVCPTCGYDFYIEDLGQTMYCEFCPSCGQALDWSDDDAKV